MNVELIKKYYIEADDYKIKYIKSILETIICQKTNN